MKRNISIGVPAGRIPHSGTGEEPRLIRVLLADDHVVVREGFRLLLEKEPNIRVIGEARTGQEAVQLASAYLPDVILMDISMPELNGIQSAHAILKRHPGMKIIILSMADSDDLIQHSLRIGIQGYLLKDCGSQELVKAIKEVVLNDNPYYGPPVQKKVFKMQNAQVSVHVEDRFAGDQSLTPRELEILQLVADGKSTPEIAKILIVSTKTVQRHRQHLMDKLDIHDAVGLVRYAIHKGISRV